MEKRLNKEFKIKTKKKFKNRTKASKTKTIMQNKSRIKVINSKNKIKKMGNHFGPNFSHWISWIKKIDIIYIKI
jgi:hypothetical protein